MMRFAALLVLTVCACDDEGRSPRCEYNGTTYARGDVFPAGDGCNSCSCEATGIACTEIACVDAGVDANPSSCAPSNGCPRGPSCGGLCCGTGEKCVADTCQCGTAPACGAGDSCEAAGPIGTDSCGSICCGSNGPCPL